MLAPQEENTSWVDDKRGVVSREIFFSEDVYQLERKRIFARAWLYIAHASEIANPGDFVTRSMGDVPVIAVRADDGSVSVLLNTCRHRGVRVCRADRGSAKNFSCPYHGWTYDQKGRLITTTVDQLLPENTDFSQWGLIAAPRIDSYKDLIFASLDPGAVDLADYLGDFRWYLDIFFSRTPGGMQVMAPPQRSRVRTNWKTAAVNFGVDNQHIFTTHVGPFAVQPVTIPWPQRLKAMEQGVQVVAAERHCISLGFTEFEEPFELYPAEMRPLFSQVLSADQQKILSGLISGAGTLFPNLSFLERMIPSEKHGLGKTVILRLWQPVGPREMEIVSWCLIDREASPAYRERSLADGLRNFGISGLFEQEDVELWASIGDASRNALAAQHPFSFMTAVSAVNTPVTDFFGPGEACRPILTEVTQFRFLQAWNRMMAGEP
jgi:nitrite reductase/ring-hydroxylating ferredoxin subunit